MTSEQTVELSVLWSRLVGHRRPVTWFVLVATLVTGVVAFLLPKWFQATASLLPPSEEQTGFGLSRFFRAGSVPGIRIPTQSTPGEVMVAVLQGRRLAEQVVTRFDLVRVYNCRNVQDAVLELRRHCRFRLSDAGTIEMAVEDRSPTRARDMAQAYIDLLDQFNREIRSTKGRRTREFVEQRLTETKAELARAEQALADYQAAHKAAIITPAMSTATETAARIYAQRTALQVRLGVVRSYSRERSQEEQQIVDQLAQLDRQLRSLPGTGLELARLLRDVQTFEQLYELLTSQYEEARIDEARDVVTLDVLDPPVVPARKIRPHRLLMMLVGFTLSLGLGVAYVLFQEEKRPAPALVSGFR